MMNENITDYILNIPDATELSSMPPALQSQIRALDAQWPSFPLLNTHAVDGRKLIHARLAERLTEAELEGLFAEHGLDWQVWFIRSAYSINPVITCQNAFGENIIGMEYLTIKPIDKAALLPFMNEMTVERAPTMDDVIHLPMYAGTDPVAV